jgi:hypothetical protein
LRCRGLIRLKVVPRQMVGQRAAAAPGSLALARRGQRCRIGRCRLRLHLGLGLILLDPADHELELLDGAVELFRRAADPGPAQHRQLYLQLLDVQGLGMDLGVPGRDPPLHLDLQRGCEGAQFGRIGGQGGRRQRHAPV